MYIMSIAVFGIYELELMKRYFQKYNELLFNLTMSLNIRYLIL